MNLEMSAIEREMAELNSQWQSIKDSVPADLLNQFPTQAHPQFVPPQQAFLSKQPIQQQQQPQHTFQPQTVQQNQVNQQQTFSSISQQQQTFQHQQNFSLSQQQQDTFIAQKAPTSFYSPIQTNQTSQQQPTAPKSPSFNRPLPAPPPQRQQIAVQYNITQPHAAPVKQSNITPMPQSIQPSKSAAKEAEQMAIRLAALKKNANVGRPKEKKLTIDIALLMDLTGSMQIWFDQAKQKVKEIVDEVHLKYPEAGLKMAFIGYRDFTDDGTSHYEIHDFSSAPEMSSFMNRIPSCAGGFDAAEDVIGGLNQVSTLRWTAKTRLVVFIADAPGHGIEFHDMGQAHDRYLLCQDPNGLGTQQLRDIIRQLANKNIDFHFFHLMDVTDKMERLLNDLLATYNTQLWTHKLDQNIDQFLPNVVQSIDSSVMRSTWG